MVSQAFEIIVYERMAHAKMAHNPAEVSFFTRLFHSLISVLWKLAAGSPQVADRAILVLSKVGFYD